MEGRSEEEADAGIPNSMSFTSPPVKLPLAPIFTTLPDRRGNATISNRRGSSIFSPTQTLDPPQHHHNFNPSPPRNGPTPNSDSADGGGATASSVIRYKECRKNHAASMGGHVVDGCGEFMPAGDDGTPQALRCAACDCHRNFHRRSEAEGQQFHSSYPHNPNSTGSLQTQTQSHHLQRHSYFATPSTMVSFGGGAAAVESSSEDLNVLDAAAQASVSGSKKRFRTKFRQDQKERMHEFATKLGWRLQKQDEQEVQEFCSEVGVKRQAFKIWMHNNKQAMKRRSSSDV